MRTKPTIFLDMDGVLADFDGAMADRGVITSKTQPSLSRLHVPKEQWTPEQWAADKIFCEHMDHDEFWPSLPIMPGARDLWFSVRELNPWVLTARPRDTVWGDRIAAQKRQWIGRVFGQSQADRFICCLRDEKKQWAPGNILVDDMPRNCEEWSNAGGTAILFTNSQSAITELGRLLYAA